MHGVDNFNEGRLIFALHILARGVDISMKHGKCDIVGTAGAATTLTTSGSAKHGTVIAARLLTGKLALGLGAESWSAALPCALGGFAQGRAVGFGGSASSAANGGAADGLALGASSLTFTFHFAHFLGAADRADRLLAVNFAFGTFTLLFVKISVSTRFVMGEVYYKFWAKNEMPTRCEVDERSSEKSSYRFAIHLAVGASAYRVALGGADGIIAKPFALGVALWLQMDILFMR